MSACATSVFVGACKRQHFSDGEHRSCWHLFGKQSDLPPIAQAGLSWRVPTPVNGNPEARSGPVPSGRTIIQALAGGKLPASIAIHFICPWFESIRITTGDKPRTAPRNERQERKDDTGDLEQALVRDALFALQGVDGRYIHYSAASDAYLLDHTVWRIGCLLCCIPEPCFSCQHTVGSWM